MSTINISCPKCNATNRLPTERLSDNPKCGKCKTRLFKGKPIELTAANVASTLNHNEIPVLVDCWAPWCGPCRNFAPTFEKAAAEFEPDVRLAKLNTEDQQAIASRWRISSIPTLIVFNGGKKITRHSGVMSLTQMKQWFNNIHSS